MKHFLVFQATVEIDTPLSERQIEKLTDNVICGMTEELDVNRKDGLIDDYNIERILSEKVS